MPDYEIVEADGSKKIMPATNLREAIGKAKMPSSVNIVGSCPKHDFASLKGRENEGVREFCRVCGATR